MAILRVVTIDGEIFTFPISKEKVSIGRGLSNDLVLQDSTVSRQHAVIKKVDQGYILTDMGSYNGTKVNGQLIQSSLLDSNDQIELGSTKLTFIDESQSSTPPTDSLVFSSDVDKELRSQPMIESHSFTFHQDSRELLIPLNKDLTTTSYYPSHPQKHVPKSELSQLTRSNKVLFVLYEISRELNMIHDIQALLTRIMDLIFVVIQADSGFLVLIETDENEKLLPVVIKHRNSGARQHREI